MNAETRTIVEQVLEGFQSMNRAVQNAGGVIPSIDGLREMSGLDLAILLAQNHIYMEFRKP